MIPTPSTAHVNLGRIYEPAEDSFLLLDTLASASETDFLTHRFSQKPSAESQNAAPLVVEIGTGSGVVLGFFTANAKKLIGTTDVLILGVDINAYACVATEQTVLRACRETSCTNRTICNSHAMFMGCVNADLSSCLQRGAVDVLVFNPPYVPTAELPVLPQKVNDDLTAEADNFDEDSQLLSLSYAGGKDGMEVTDRLLDELPVILSAERGVAYILLCKQNKPESVVKRIKAWGRGWSVEVVGRSGKTAGWEKLQILRIWRTNA